MARLIEIAKAPTQTWGCVSLFEVRDVASGRLSGREVRVTVPTEGVIAIRQSSGDEVRVTVPSEGVIAVRPLIPARGGLASILGVLVAREQLWSGSQHYEARAQRYAYQCAIDELSRTLAAQLEQSDLRSFDRDLD